jgi:hypothetical protein
MNRKTGAASGLCRHMKPDGGGIEVSANPGKTRRNAVPTFATAIKTH